VEAYRAAGGEFITWREGRALEDELFLSLPDVAVDIMLQRAVEFLDRELVAAHIGTQSQGRNSLDDILLLRQQQHPYSSEVRLLLALTSRNRKNGWYKSLTKFEILAREIVGPNYQATEAGFTALIRQLFGGAHAA
jgi:hypothetical protein